ncbi:MAG: ABC transporter ATP-binding protein/permease, partial [Actinomyces sp.]|nr:ABC transporter ATP-binding protein/permease [Actinomyces sp.]
MTTTDTTNVLRRYARLISEPTRPLLTTPLLANALSGVLRGVSLVVLLPASVALSTGESAWGLDIRGWVLLLAVLALLGGVIEYRNAITGYTVALDLIQTVHTRLGNRMAALPLGWFRSSSSGRLSRLVSKELLQLGESVAHMLAPVVPNAASAIVMVVGGWLWDWRLGLVLTVAVPLYWGVLRLARRALDRGKAVSEPAERELGDRIVEFARCQGALRSCGRGSSFVPLQEANAASLLAQRRDLWWGILANLLHGMAGQLIVVALIVLAARLALGDALGPVQTIAFIGLSLRFTQTLEEIGGKVVAVEERQPMLDHVDEILDAAVLPEPTVPAVLSAPGTIELDHVDFYYEASTPVLRDVSLTVPAGSMCALVGPSGSGKSTIAKLIARFYDVDAGTVEVGGVDVRDQPVEQLMSQLSMVFQDVYLFDETLEENIRIGRPEASDQEIREAARLAGVTEIVDRLPAGWRTRVGEGGRALSGGERQRVSV